MSTAIQRTRAEAESAAADLAEYGPPREHEITRHHGVYGCRCGRWHGASIVDGYRHTRHPDADQDGAAG